MEVKSKYIPIKTIGTIKDPISLIGAIAPSPTW